MPALGTSGAASAYAFGRRGGFLPQATFRGGMNTGNATTMNKPAGVAVGDLVIFINSSNIGGTTGITTQGGSPWSSISSGALLICWKVLNATDVANNWNAANANTYGTMVAWIPNGATAINVGAIVTTSGLGTFTLPGVSAAGSRGIVALYEDDVGTSGALPPGFTTRFNTNSGPNFPAWMADNMSGGYNGGNVVWTANAARTIRGALIKFT